MSGSTIQILDIQHLHQPPFDTLSAQQRTHLQQHSKIVYLDNLQPIPAGWQGDFFIILKGFVHQLQGEALISTLNAGDWFDTKVRQSGVFNFITQQQSLMYRIDGQVLSAITEQNPTLKNALFADVAARLNHHQARLAQSESQKLLYQPIANLGQHIKPPHFVDDTATLYDATMAMNQFDIKHILVKSQA
nr:hypothetical protein [Moraxella osloensis]